MRVSPSTIWEMTVDIQNQGIDRTEVRRALALMVDPDASHEIRALPSGRSATIYGSDLDAAVAAVEQMADGKGTYITLNPVRANLKGAARVADVLCRRRLLIDCDRTTAKDENASEEEKLAARVVCDAVLDDLTARGWPRPIVLDSGNGWHLLYSIDLPNDKLSQQLISRCLKALQSAHGTDAAEVDTKVHNASRITKLPGTWVRKGPHTEDRPHRMARLVSVPAAFTIVPEALLRQLAGLDTPSAPAVAPDSVWEMTVPTPGTHEYTAYITKAVNEECGRLALTPEGNRNNVLNDAAFRLGTLLHLEGARRAEIEASLRLAALRSGLGDREIEQTLRSGLDDGAKNPRTMKDRTAPRRAAAEIPADVRITVRASEIRTKRVNWLWQDRIPVGFITLFAGRTGLGKSFVTCDLAARITQGEDLPDGPSGLRGECRNVLFISEDPYEYVLAPRLMELGADLTRISFFTWETMAQYRLDDTSILDRAIAECGDVAMVCIDPPTNFLGDGIDEHKNSAVRSVLMHLVGWLAGKEIACVLITHVNKPSGKGVDALSRIIGSVAWATTARIAHLFAADPDDAGRCLFCPDKNNLGQKAKTLAYRIKSTDTLAVVEWDGVVDMTSDEAMSGEKKKSRGVVATEWLVERFRERREWQSDELKRAGVEAGLSRNALFSPEVAALPIRKRQVVTANGDRHWVWQAEEYWPPATQ